MLYYFQPLVCHIQSDIYIYISIYTFLHSLQAGLEDDAKSSRSTIASATTLIIVPPPLVRES